MMKETAGTGGLFVFRMQLSVKDVSVLLDVPAETVYRWVGKNEVPAHRVNDDVRFDRVELLEWAMARDIRVSPSLFTVGESGRAPRPTLAAALAAGGVAHRVGGTDPLSVLRAAARLLRVPEPEDRDLLCQMWPARKNLGFIGAGDGVAVPRVRTPVVLPAAVPAVTLCFLENAVDFRAADGKPVRALFAFVCPTVMTHLHLLSRLGFVLRAPAFKAALARQGAAGEILAALAETEASIVPLPKEGVRCG